MNALGIAALIVGLSFVDPMLAHVAMGQAPGAKEPPRKEATSTRPAPTDAVEVLAAMRAALAAEAWSCRCQATGGMMGVFAADSTLIFRHDAQGAVTAIRLTGNFLPRVPRFDAASSDGATIRVADLDEKIYEDAPWGSQTVRLAGMSRGAETLRWIVPLAFFQPSDLVPKDKDVVKLSGTAIADGVLCDVIELERALPAIPELEGAREITRYVVGRDDRFPRRVVKQWPARRPGGLTSSTPYELTAWNPKPNVDSHTFEVDVTGMNPGKFKGPSAPAGQGAREVPGSGGPFSLGPKKGDLAEDFALRDTAGKEHKLSAYKGKVVLVHFSKLDDDAPDDLLTKMKAKHGDKLVVLDLVVDRSGGGLDAVKKAKKPATFPRLVGGKSVAEEWGIKVFSSAIVVGPDGKIAANLPTNIVGGNPTARSDALVKRMGEYLKDPAKGW